MITAGSYPPISIDLGKDEAGMILQYRERDGHAWRLLLQGQRSTDYDAPQ